MHSSVKIEGTDVFNSIYESCLRIFTRGTTAKEGPYKALSIKDLVSCCRHKDPHLMASFTRKSCVRPYNQGKTIPNFNEARDNGVRNDGASRMAVASDGPCANDLHVALVR